MSLSLKTLDPNLVDFNTRTVQLFKQGVALVDKVESVIGSRLGAQNLTAPSLVDDYHTTV